MLGLLIGIGALIALVVVLIAASSGGQGTGTSDAAPRAFVAGVDVR